MLHSVEFLIVSLHSPEYLTSEIILKCLDLLNIGAIQEFSQLTKHCKSAKLTSQFEGLVMIRVRQRCKKFVAKEGKR